MRKAFNKEQQPLPIIPPPDPEPEVEKPVNVTNDEMFGREPQVKLEVEAKRGVGKRGKDKKPRVKKPLSEKQLAHLKRIRGLAQAKRMENKKKKDVIRNKAKAEIEELKKVKFAEPVVAEPPPPEVEALKSQPVPVTTPPTNEVVARRPIVEEEVVRKVKPTPTYMKQETKVHKYGGYEQFFELMDKYEEHREKKRQTKRMKLRQHNPTPIKK